MHVLNFSQRKFDKNLSIDSDEDKAFLCVWLLCYVNSFADSRMEVRRYRRIEQKIFFTGTSLLLNAQRRRIWSVVPSSIRESYKWSSQTHKLINLSSSSRFITKALWIDNLMNTSTSKLKHLENAYRNLLNAHLVYNLPSTLWKFTRHLSISSTFVLRDVIAQEWIPQIIRKQSTAHASVLTSEQILAFLRFFTE